jgi:hypothetical protein
MAINVLEKFESRRLQASRDGRASHFTLVLAVTGSMDQLAVKNAANAFAPEVWGSGFPQLWKQTVEIQCIGTEGDGIWEAVVRYDTSGPEPLSANDSFEFEIGGGSQHITQAYATTAYPSDLPNNAGAIGVTEDGVQGADIYAPEMTFSETHFYNDFSPTYKRTLFSLRGRVNSSAFKGWAAGEVLFEGVSARRQDNRTTTPWGVTYRFRVSPNEEVTVAGNTFDKFGWDLLDIRFEEGVVSGNGVRQAVGAYVHRVYLAGNFALLGIGV